MTTHNRWLTLVVDEFKKNSLATNFCFGLVLLMLEKIVETDFACPCATAYNMHHTFLFFIVPPVIVFFLMFAIKFPCKSCKSCESCKRCQPSESCESCKRCQPSCKSFGEALMYTIVPAMTWLVLLFLDGRYYACLRTNWSGKYEIIENGEPERWCKPDNSSQELLAKTQYWYSESQFIGFWIALGSAIIYLPYLCCCCRTSSSPQRSSSEEDKEENIQLQ